MAAPCNTGASTSGDWFKHAFNELYPIIYAHRSVEAAEPEARFAAKALGLAANHVVLDLCCGDGRHLVHLHDVTDRVFGLDYSPTLLRIAKDRVETARLVRADMRAIPFAGAFDAVVSFFTSFGYFDNPDENLSVVRGVAHALVSGGRFFIDYLNPCHVAQTLVPESERTAHDYLIRERRWISKAPWRVHKATQVFEEGRLVDESTESVQLYTPNEFVELLRSGGLCVDRLLGDFSETPLDDTQPRLIAIGHRS